MDTIYLLLDYDGFVCKAFYASLSCGRDVYEILKEMEDNAIKKASKLIEGNPCKAILTIKFMSGHSWKKDYYPDYKLGRKKNEDLGELRKEILENDNIVYTDIEADELIIMIHEVMYLEGIDNLIVSDDKDLKYYTQGYITGINESSDIIYHHENLSLFQQMLAGDSEDHIQGIPKVGMKTAAKLLNGTSYDIDAVINIYKDKGISPEECIKQLVLCIPLSIRFNNEAPYIIDIVHIMMNNNFVLPDAFDVVKQGLIDYVTEKVTSIYKENNIEDTKENSKEEGNKES